MGIESERQMELYTDERTKEKKTSPLWFSTAIQLSNSIFEAAYNLSSSLRPRCTCSLFSLSAHLGFFKVNPASIFKVFKIVPQYSFWTRQVLRKYNKAWFRYMWKSSLSGSSPAWQTARFSTREGWGGSHLFSVQSSPSSLLVVCVTLPDSLCLTATGKRSEGVGPVYLWRTGLDATARAADHV